MESETSKESDTFISIDTNTNDFYNQTRDEVELDLSRLRKNVEMVKQLRITAAENEVKTAALFHANLFQCVEKLKSLNKQNSINEKILIPAEDVPRSEDQNEVVASQQ